MRFVNPHNQHVVRVGSFAPLWALLFGPFYFLYKGELRWAVFCIFLVPWLISPFVVRGVLKRHFLRQGFMPLADYRARERGAKRVADAERDAEERRNPARS